MQNLDLMPEIDLQTRVFVKKPAGEYTEIAGIESFERIDHDDNTSEIAFVMADGQERALADQFMNQSENAIEVKMELSIGMLMKFSGYITQLTGNTISIAVTTPITTDIIDLPDSATLH